MRSIALPVLIAICACTFSACARDVVPQHPSAETVSAACSTRAHAGRYREMTWNEYYARVREHAWRSGASVIWLNPPRVRRVPAGTAQATACK